MGAVTREFDSLHGPQGDLLRPAVQAALLCEGITATARWQAAKGLDPEQLAPAPPLALS